MRKYLAKDIKKCMTNFQEVEDGHIIAEFKFDSGFRGFEGHFKDKPILPGICKILAALEVLSEGKKKVQLKEIVSAKFFHPVTYNEKILFDCLKVNSKSDSQLVKIKITRNGDKIAELKLKVVEKSVI